MFHWNYLPAKSTAGGIIVGVNADVLEVVKWEVLDISVICWMKNKLDGFEWRVVVVYGSPYEEGRLEFISELHQLFINCKVPTLIGGDFNLVRYQKDKSNGIVDFKWCEKFNEWINIWNLLGIHLSGRQSTWANNQENTILSKIDRVFCSTCFDANFPLDSAKVLPRIGSDRAPIL